MERRERMDKTSEKLGQIVELVSKMSVLKDQNLELSKQYQSDERKVITKDSFLGIEVGSRIDLDSHGTYYGICIYEDTFSVKFVVVAEKYSVLNVHSHNFKESLMLIEGRVRELVSNQVLLPKDRIIIEPTKEHGFMSEEFSIYSMKVYLQDK